jgi:hypothetical protein
MNLTVTVNTPSILKTQNLEKVKITTSPQNFLKSYFISLYRTGHLRGVRKGLV